MAFGTYESVLFIEVSSIQGCPYREVPHCMYIVTVAVTVAGYGTVDLSLVSTLLYRHHVYIYTHTYLL